MTFLPQIIGSIGLMFDIVGVVLLFYYGPPTLPITAEGFAVLPFNANDTEIATKNKAIFNRHQRFSCLALVLLLVGFALQLIGNLMQIPFRPS